MRAEDTDSDTVCGTTVGEPGGVLTVDEVERGVVVGSVILVVVVLEVDVSVGDTGGAGVEGVTLDVVRSVVALHVVWVVGLTLVVTLSEGVLGLEVAGAGADVV